MAEDEEEARRLRTAALKNVEGILIARQNAERQLADVHESLERRTAELQQQREWFEVTLSSIGDAVITADTSGRVTFLNPVAQGMTGWTSEEAHGHVLEDVFHIINEDTGKPAPSPIRDVLLNGRVVGLANHTALIHRRSGEATAIEDSAAPILDATGGIAGAVMVFHDVTSRRRAERALRASEERLRAMFDQAAVGIAVVGLDTHFLEMNQKFCDILGYSFEELRAMTFLDFTYPADIALTKAHVESLVAGKTDHYTIEKRYVRKGGAIVWSRTTVALLRDEAGKPLQYFGVIEDITQRRNAEEAIREGARRLSLALSAANLGDWSWDAKTDMVTLGSRASKIFGWPKGQLVSWADMRAQLLPEDGERVDAAVKAAIANRSDYDIEYRVVRPNGERAWVAAKGQVIYGPDDAVLGMVGVVQDVTERRSSEESLRETAQRLQLALSAGDLSDWSWDIRTDVLTVGPKLRDLFGVPRDAELKAAQLRDFLVIEDGERQREAARKALAERTPFNLEYQWKRPGAPIYWLTARGQGVYGPDGAVLGMIGVAEEVTEQKQTEMGLNRLAAVVESSQDAIISKNLSSVIQTWNRAAEHMFGYTAAEAVGQSVTMLIPEGHLDEEPSILSRLKRGERIEHYETVRRHKNGSLIQVSLSVSPLRDASGRVIGASKIVRDITLQKVAEAENARLYEAAQREIASRQRAEAALRETDKRKDEFLATLAHELRNPLAPIRQAALISKAPTATEAQKRWSHDVISRQVHHMAILLDDLLDISRITRGTLELRKEMTDVVAVVEAAVETARPAIDAKRHTLIVDTPKEPIHFEADPLRLAQVLSNLLTNAAKYTDPEGQIRLTVAQADAVLSIRVTDSGIGIPEDALQSVFAMFSQVKSGHDRSEGGLGIGLALSRGLVELHEGTLTAKSAGAGQGSEFVVTLPLRSRKVQRVDDRSGKSTSPIVKRRILIADDNRDAAESLALLLKMEGHDVTVVHDGPQALAAFASVRPEVALLDIGMPGLNGYEVARQVRQGTLGRAVTLIAVTGWGQDSDKAQALAAGFNHHFTKPIEPERLSALLRSDNP